MAIETGSRLGPYEILSPLGAGGMGEVFRARDTRLAREVAIKVLPAAVAADPERLKRFEKEARSASALNHPSIVTIYDIGETEGVSWIAMELVDGKTLRELLASGALPVKRLLQLATSVAEGLAKAHEAGIVHRDLKPENVMVTKDGHVKILDFGLAKLTSTGSGSGEGSLLPTMTGTTPGVVVGTVGYMSPEQASGEAVDFRSDQFSFGSVLYELATGKRAFQKKTAIDTLGAILNSEPEPIAQLAPQVPAPLRWIVERCLSKDPDQRYASTKDLTRELAMVRDHLSETSGIGSEAPTSRRRSRLVPALAAGAILGIAAGLLVPLLRPHAASVPRFSRVTFRQGAIGTARFAPDGETILYSAVFEGRPYDIFSARPGVPESRAIGIPGADLLSLSGSGEMALRMLETGTLARASLAGGAPRELLEDVLMADWAPNGRDLAIVRRQAGGMNRLEYPVGKVLHETSQQLGRPRISPDGRRVAVYAGDSVLVLDREGRKTDLKDIGWGPAWSPAGTEILDFVNRGGSTGISATNLRGRSRPVLELAGTYYLQDVSRAGRLLLERTLVRNEVVGLVSGQDRERNLSWLDTSVPVDLSVDGQTLLFMDNAGGGLALPWVYIRKTDGSDAVRIGEGLATSLSPDGKWALALPGFSPSRVDLLPTGAGQPRSISVGKLQLRRNGVFFPDGRRVLLEGSMPGQDVRLYVLDLEGGGAARPISAEGYLLGAAFSISPDGKQILSRAADGRLYILDTNGGAAPRAVAAFPENAEPIRWCDDGRRVFARENLKVYKVDLASGRKELWREFGAVDRGQLDVILATPDGKSYVTGYHRYLSDLWVVDGVK